MFTGFLENLKRCDERRRDVYVKRSGQLDFNARAYVQQILPDDNDLREIPECLKQDVQETMSSQRAQLQQPCAPSATTSFTRSALTPSDDEGESLPFGTRGSLKMLALSLKQASSIDSTENELSPAPEAQEASIKSGNEEEHTARGSGSESEHPNCSTAPYLCFCEAMVSKVRFLMQQKKDLMRSIDNLSSLFVDAILRQGRDLMPVDACNFAQDSPLPSVHPSSARHARPATGDKVRQEPDSVQKEMDGGGEGERRKTRTRGSSTSFEVGRKRGLLGECGPAIKAAYEVLKEVEDLQSSDELMHFEFCGPFWELSEV
jgi:hypothetical protein